VKEFLLVLIYQFYPCEEKNVNHLDKLRAADQSSSQQQTTYPSPSKIAKISTTGFDADL
jgi:hypothetical protein